jgi:hypothetical protein
MTATEVQPVELVRTPVNGRELLGRFVVILYSQLLTALILMWAAPHLNEVVGSPRVHPGYWVCALIVIAFQSVVPTVLPREAKYVIGRKPRAA